jgi:hypothetical protein
MKTNKASFHPSSPILHPCLEEGMSPKAGLALALLLILVSLSPLRGEDSGPQSSQGNYPPAGTVEAGPAPLGRPGSGMAPVTNPAETLPPPTAVPPPSLSNWITHQRPDCCYPFGGNGPINAELYISNGPSIPAAGSLLHHILDTGWDVQAGGRSLFFNPSVDAAWTIDLSISNIFNHGQPTPTVPVILPTQTSFASLADFKTMTIQAHLRQLNRTFANLAGGREWYLIGPANASGWKWRAGLDVGGRLGTAKAVFAETVSEPVTILGSGTFGSTRSHFTDTIYGLSISLHTDLERSCGCCTFLAGFRAEWDYTWMDILKGDENSSDLQDVNLLFTFGVRF